MIRSTIAIALSLALVSAQAVADESTAASPPQTTAPEIHFWQPHHHLLAQAVIVTPAPTPPPPPTTIVEPAPQTTIVNPPAAPEPSTAVDYQPRTGLIIGGLVTFGVAYAVSAVAGSIKEDHCDQVKDPSDDYICRTQSWPVYVPLAGPFIQMGYVDGNGRNTVRTLLAVDGAVQVGGFVMAIVGMAASSEPAKVTTVALNDHVFLMPIASRDGTGIGASGTF